MPVKRILLTPSLGRCYHPGSMESVYLTKKELLAYLKVSRTIVEKLMRQGLPHIKLDRRVLFRREDVDAFMAKKIVK